MEEGFPPWAARSIAVWLEPFFRPPYEPSEWDHEKSGYEGRDFLTEVELNVRIQLDWRRARKSAYDDLIGRFHQDPSLPPKVVDLALRNIQIGYHWRGAVAAVKELDRILHESGAVWEVVPLSESWTFALQRRTSRASAAALEQLAGEREGDHLRKAWAAAYGRDPNPDEAYREAIKAVEVAAIPVVTPNDATATLGKVISTMRQSPATWTATFPISVPVPGIPGSAATPVEVVLQMMDLLWKNHTERHGVPPPAPVVPVTQKDAEFAVHLALVLVHAFRSGAVARA